jgi:methylthioribose-1-phosphate isomerase
MTDEAPERAFDEGQPASTGEPGMAQGEDESSRAQTDSSGDQASGVPDGPKAQEEAGSVDRRSFFRVFSRQTISTVAQVAGMANAVQRGTAAALTTAAELGLGSPQANAERFASGAMTAPALDDAGETFSGLSHGSVAEAPPRFRSPYRVAADMLYVLDQRLVPDRLEEISCRRGADVAFLMRTMAVTGGPLLAQVAAYGLALTALEVADRRWQERSAELRRATQVMTFARPSARMVRWAMDRLEPIWKASEHDLMGTNAASAMRAEAEAIASEVSIGNSQISRTAAELLRQPNGQVVRVLVHGDPGTLTSGMIGTGLAAIQQLAGEGHPIKVWLTETRPFLEGARLAAWELRLAGIEHTVLPDSAVAWLLEHEPVDAVLLGAEWIAANGDTANVVGSRAVAELASLGLRDGVPVPVYVCAPVASIGLDAADGKAIPPDMRPGRDLATFQSGFKPPREGLLNPATDVVPASRITAFVTEEGVLGAPFGKSLAEAVAASDARRPAPRPTPEPESAMPAGSATAVGSASAPASATTAGSATATRNATSAESATSEGSAAAAGTLMSPPSASAAQSAATPEVAGTG